MIIDAAGGNGATFYPRFRSIERSEPQRHELLKTKMTFAVVHGTGTCIYQSFPDLGCQGGNLTLEVCFRGLFIVELIKIYYFVLLYYSILS